MTRFKYNSFQEQRRSIRSTRKLLVHYRYFYKRLSKQVLMIFMIMGKSNHFKLSMINMDNTH